MKLLYTSDWQVQVSNLDRCELMLQEIVNIIKTKDIGLVVHCGDFKDTFNPIDVRVTNFLIRATQTIVALCPMVGVAGNHDKAGPGDHFPSCMPVIESAGATVFENPGVYKIDDRWYLYCVPYMRDNAELRKVLNRRPKECNLCAFHAGVRGAEVSVQHKDAESELVPSDFAAFAFAGGGHYHFNQQFAKNAVYVGSPFPVDWSEANQSKSYTVLHLEGKQFSVDTVLSTNQLWWDPSLPDFDEDKAKSGPCQLRVHIPYTSAEQFQKAVTAVEKEYPKATVHAVPIYGDNQLQEPDDLTLSSDEDLITKFLKANPVTKDAPAAVAYLSKRLQQTGMGDMFQIKKATVESVYGENVLSFKTINLKLNVPGITLVTGKNEDWTGRSNGAGKSSAMSVLFAAMWDQTPKGQKGNAWIRRGEAKATAGTLLTLHDGRACQIQRKRPGAHLDITVGKPIGNTQQLIDKLTMPWDVAQNSLYIGQREISTILTGKPKERQELFSRFLGLDRFIKAQVLVRQDIAKLKTQQLEAQEEIRICQAEVERHKSLLAMTTTSPDYIDKNKAAAQSTKLKSTIEEQVQQLRSNQKHLGDRQTELQELSHDVHTERESIARIQGKIKLLQKQIAATKDIGATCHVCGSTVQPKTLTAHRKSLMDRIENLTTKEEAHRKELTNLGTQEENCTAKINYLKSGILNTRLRIQKLQGSVDSLHAQRQRSKEMEAVGDEHKTAMKKWQRVIAHHEAHLKQLLTDMEFLSACEKVVSREGLPTFLCSLVCPQLNNSAKQLSRHLATDEILVQFAVTDGSIDVEIHNEHGGENVQDQSEGELRLAGLMTALTFREVLVPWNVIFLDEPSEGLDENNAKVFGQGINILAARFKSVFITSHNPFLLSELKPVRHLEVVKKNKVSTLNTV